MVTETSKPPMDPQIKSLLTSAALIAVSAGVGWAVKQGFVSASDQANIINDVMAIGGVLVAGLVTWWKARQQSPKALIQAVNAQDNGVKVVPADSSATMVDGPLKGTK